MQKKQRRSRRSPRRNPRGRKWSSERRRAGRPTWTWHFGGRKPEPDNPEKPKRKPKPAVAGPRLLGPGVHGSVATGSGPGCPPRRHGAAIGARPDGRRKQSLRPSARLRARGAAAKRWTLCRLLRWPQTPLRARASCALAIGAPSIEAQLSRLSSSGFWHHWRQCSPKSISAAKRQQNPNFLEWSMECAQGKSVDGSYLRHPGGLQQPGEIILRHSRLQGGL